MKRNQSIAVMQMQVNALRECIDLVSNGYRVIVRFTHDEYWYFKLRHHRNRSIIEVRVDAFGMVVRKDGKESKVIKSKVDPHNSSFSIIV